MVGEKDIHYKVFLFYNIMKMSSNINGVFK